MTRRRAPVHGLALCGAGWVSVVHAAAAQTLGIPVVAVASRDPRHAVARTEQTGGQAVLYDELPAGADLVAVCTPPALHTDQAISMLEAGSSVIVEKPLCTTLADADRLVAAAAAHGHRLLYAENLAAAPVVQALVARAGTIGALTHLEVRSLQSPPTWGEFTTDAWGGGALFDLGAHPLAVALLVARAARCGDLVSVSATLRGGAGHGSDEHAEVTLRFAGGLLARVIASWQGGPSPVWDAQLASATGVLRAEIQPAPALEHNGEPVAVAASDDPLRWAGYTGQLAGFLDDLTIGRRPVMDAVFGRDVLDATCAAYWSAGRGGEDMEVPFTGPRDRTPLQLWRGA